MPIQVAASDDAHPQVAQKDDITLNLSQGGLAFYSQYTLPVGQGVFLSFPWLREKQEPLYALVAWNKKNNRGYDIGVVFSDSDDLFKVRMVEQVLQIQNYQKQQFTQHGRDIPVEQAASEWIAQYASDFPGPGNQD